MKPPCSDPSNRQTTQTPRPSDAQPKSFSWVRRHRPVPSITTTTKLTCTGPSGSGKSTIIRKLRMQSGIRIPDDEREQVREEILSQMHDALVASIAELKVRGALAASISDVVRTALKQTRNVSMSGRTPANPGWLF
jgi:hypothetical protein